MDILTEVAKNESQSIVNLVKNEIKYLCCYNNYAQDFEEKKVTLNGTLEDVSRKIDKARGISNVTSTALQWKREAEQHFVIDTKKEKCCNGLCLNCWRQYRKGKDLAKRTLDIDKLLERCNNLNIADGPTNLPGIKYQCLPNFMHFESRNSKLQDLKEALECEENNMIGLKGSGGTGKTSMAKEVGAELEGSTFSKVIFLVVSKPPDFKKLRGEIARHLDLKPLDGEVEVHNYQILNKISELKEKCLLIVLDDMWEEFDLTKELGIPPHHMNKCCTVLITTRINDICEKMECQREILLEELTDKEALSLFLEHSKSSSNLESLAQNIVKHCHGVPVVIVAVARSLKGRTSRVWREALRSLQNGKSILNVGGDELKKAYEGLKLSYDHLENENAKELFLISSLFPEDFEIPIEFLIRIGMGSFGEVDDYNERRRKLLYAIEELLDSSLLLNAKRECVKMHDLVHEVALVIGEKDIQSVTKPELSVKEGLRYLFLENYDFQKRFDGRNLEVLLLVLKCQKNVEVPDSFFTEMIKLKVLLLQSKAYHQLSASSLFPSVQSLQDIRTLKIVNLELSSIFVLGKLPNLETLWLDHCSIIELSGENVELEKLRLLRIENCRIDKSNPFQLVEACPRLQELILLSNEYKGVKKEDKISENVTFHALEIYQISCHNLSSYFEQYSYLSRCLRPGNYSKCGISEATFKKLARTSELLILEEGDVGTEKRNLIPGIVPLEDGGTTDLIILNLLNLYGLECLVDAMNNRLHVNAFFNLVELSLREMGLRNVLFDGNYSLSHLKVMILGDCPKLTSIFHPLTTQSLLQLEELTIDRCDALECIVKDMSSEGEIAGHDGGKDQKNYETLFPKFKILQIFRCRSLEIISPILLSGGLMERIIIQECVKLKHIFDKFQDANVKLPSGMEMELNKVPSLIGIFREYKNPISSSLQQQASTAPRDNLKEIPPSSKTCSFSWAQVCCFKSRAISEEANDKEIPQESLTSKKWIDTSTATLTRQVALHFDHIKKVKLVHFSVSSASTLFTLSMASMISWEELEIGISYGLKHLVTSDNGDYKDQRNPISIFPKLKKLEIWWCMDLELLFFSSTPVKIQSLKSLTIKCARVLTYGVGKYRHPHFISNQSQNDELLFDIPALEALCFENVPEFISIGTINYKVESPSLHYVCLDEERPNLNTTKELDACTNEISTFRTAQSLLVQSLKNLREIKLVSCDNVISLSTLSIAALTISLKKLTIKECHKLKCITTHEGDAQVYKGYCSIFPRLENLEIEDCKELEFLFTSANCGLEKLKSLTINIVHKLIYVVRNYHKEQHLSNQNQNEELYFNLSALEILSIKRAPKFNSICANNYKLVLSSLQNVEMDDCSIKSFRDYDILNWTTTEELDASTDGVLHFHSIQSFLVQSLKNVKEIELNYCWNLISLSTLSITTSTISLESLTIWSCHKLKCITTDEGDAQVDKNYCSIFPTLERLDIRNCKELEFLFESTMSNSLEKLKSLTIILVPKLKYVVGNNQKKQHSCNHNPIDDELHFDLPALETLYIEDAPNFKSICANNYKPVLSSLQNVQGLHASTNGVPLFHAAQSLSIQSLKNIRKMDLVECANLISLPALSIESYLLEDLTIIGCHQLKCIVAEEDDAGTRMNNSIFSKLKNLQVSECNALEYVFPAYALRSLTYLQSLNINGAPMLKYVFGRSHHEDTFTQQHQNNQTRISFPVLKNLSLRDVPKLVSIYPKNYYLVALSLRFLNLVGFPEYTMRALNGSLVCWLTKQETKALEMGLQTLESLIVENSKIEEMFHYLTYVDTEKNEDEFEPLTLSLEELVLRGLSELVNIYAGPKHIICFHSLRKLEIEECKKLRAIFSTSTVRSVPNLKYLYISKCEELVHIVEEGYETNADDHLRHEPCFPNLLQVNVLDCNKLKYFFSITISSILPSLWYLEISNASELEHVLIRRGEIQEMAMKDVLPDLYKLTLRKLPILKSVCHGIDFQILEGGFTAVDDCPNFSFYETSTSQLHVVQETADSEVEEEVDEKPSPHLSSAQYINMGDTSIQQSISNPIFLSKVPIQTSSDLIVISVRDSSHASAKIFGEIEEEQGEPFLPPVTTILRETTLEVGVPLSSLSPKASTSGLNQSPLFNLPKPSHDHAQVCDKSHPHSTTSFEGIDNGDIKLAGMVQELPHSKDSQPRRAPFVTISQDESSKEPIVENLNSTVLPRCPSTNVKFFEEGSLITTRRHGTDMKKISYFPIGKEYKTSNHGEPFVPPTPIITSEKQALESRLPVSLIPSTAVMSPNQITMSTPFESTYGRNDQENVGITNQPLHGALGAVQNSSQFAEGGSSGMTPSIYDTNNDLSVAEVQEIVAMMKVEGFEASMLAQAFKTHPQLHLSSEFRSIELLCFSYRVLLNILNILATKTPFTITEEDKRLLAKYLNDASVLGFDKDWLQSIKMKVFNYDVSEVQRMQQVLRDLGNDLQIKNTELAIAHDQEEKAAQSAEMAYKGLEEAQSRFNFAQQEHANTRVHYSQMLQECQEILKQRDQCSEAISARFWPFGF